MSHGAVHEPVVAAGQVGDHHALVAAGAAEAGVTGRPVGDGVGHAGLAGQVPGQLGGPGSHLGIVDPAVFGADHEHVGRVDPPRSPRRRAPGPGSTPASGSSNPPRPGDRPCCRRTRPRTDEEDTGGHQDPPAPPDQETSKTAEHLAHLHSARWRRSARSRSACMCAGRRPTDGPMRSTATDRTCSLAPSSRGAGRIRRRAEGPGRGRRSSRSTSPGTTVTTPRPRRSATTFAPSLLTTTAGRSLFASEPLVGSRSTRRISPRPHARFQAVGDRRVPGVRLPALPRFDPGRLVGPAIWAAPNNWMARWTAAERDPAPNWHGRTRPGTRRRRR